MKFTIKIIILYTCFGIFLSPSAHAQKRLLTEASEEQSILPDKQSSEAVNNLKKRAKAGKIQFFNFDKEALRTSSIEIEIVPGERLIFVLDETDERGLEDFTWHGHLSGKISGSAVFVYMNGQMSGQITVGNKKYALSPNEQGKVSLYEVAEGIYPPEHPNNGEGSLKGYDGATSYSATADAVVCRVRVLVAYTNAARTGASAIGYSDMKLFIQQALSDMNQSFINSQVTHRVELAVAINVSYTESGSYDTDLNRFEGTADGFMDNVHTYRTLYGADLCALVFDNGSACGLASTISATASNAFCVVHYSCVIGNFSFAHELGHLYGCRHNPEVDPTLTPFAYGHGFNNTAKGWRTIMSYNDPASPTTRIQYWSNPNVTYGGVAMGDATRRNNARVLNERAGTVSAFVGALGVANINTSGTIRANEIGDALAINQVILSPGFTANNGSIFHAYTGACSGGFKTDEVSQPGDIGTNHIITNGNVNLYPNPSKGSFFLDVKYDSKVDVTVSVYNILGKEIYSSRLGFIDSVHLPLNLNEENAEGVYLIRVQAGDHVETKQLFFVK